MDLGLLLPRGMRVDADELIEHVLERGGHLVGDAVAFVGRDRRGEWHGWRRGGRGRHRRRPGGARERGGLIAQHHMLPAAAQQV